MNFGLNISNRVEKLLRSRVEERLRDEKSDSIDFLEEDAIYKSSLAEILAADSRISAGGNIRIGEVILIVDSDTQVVSHMLYYSQDLIITFIHSRLTVFCMELQKCFCLQKWLLYNIPQVLCRFPGTISKME